MSESLRLAKYLTQEYRAQERHRVKWISHMFRLYHATTETRKMMGDEAFRHFIKVQCPQIPWSRLQEIFDEAKRLPAGDAILRKIKEN